MENLYTDVRVKTKCSLLWLSAWVKKVTFTVSLPTQWLGASLGQSSIFSIRKSSSSLDIKLKQFILNWIIG